MAPVARLADRMIIGREDDAEHIVDQYGLPLRAHCYERDVHVGVLLEHSDFLFAPFFDGVRRGGQLRGEGSGLTCCPLLFCGVFELRGGARLYYWPTLV